MTPEQVVSVMAAPVIAFVSGLVLGWFGHRLTLARSKGERRITDETARIDHCAAILAARVDYVVAWHENAGAGGL